MPVAKSAVREEKAGRRQSKRSVKCVGGVWCVWRVRVSIEPLACGGGRANGR